MTEYIVSNLVSLVPISVSSGGTGSSTATGTGITVLSESPTITTPIISGNLQVTGNCNSVSLSTNNGPLFTYSSGTWIPTLTRLNGGSPPSISTWNNIGYQVQDGYYVKSGNLVTIWYNIQCLLSGAGNDLPSGASFPCIGNLPFICKNSSTSIQMEVSNTCTNSSWPNGIAGGSFVPAVSSPTYPYPYTSILFEYNTPVSLNIFNVATINEGTWISTGFDAPLYTNTEVYGVDVGIPPYILLAKSYTQVSNFNILGSVPTYTDIAFSGSFSYYTE